MKRAATFDRTFLVTISPFSPEDIPTASEVHKHLTRHAIAPEVRLPGAVMGSVTVLEYVVPAEGRMAYEFRMGQRVCRRTDGKIGRIRGFEYDSEAQLIAFVTLEEPYVSPAFAEFPESHGYHYLWPVWELQAIGEGERTEQAQLDIAQACEPWFERQA